MGLVLWLFSSSLKPSLVIYLLHCQQKKPVHIGGSFSLWLRGNSVGWDLVPTLAPNRQETWLLCGGKGSRPQLEAQPVSIERDPSE